MRHYLFCLLFIGVLSCRKDDSRQPYGFSKVYMPQAIIQSGGVNNDYAVPSGSDSSTYNYAIDSGLLNVFLGASLSGPATGAYTVSVGVDNDTIQRLFASGAFDTSVYKLMPSSIYTLPTQLAVTQGARSGTFHLGLSIAALKADSLAGKYLLLAVRIANPTQYTLDTALSETIVVVNVNSLVIGPAVNVTGQYILDPGNPFVASAMNGSRWGTLEDWNTNTAATSHGGVGGFSLDGDGATMDMESGWGSPQIYNGKIWQTIQLPAGTYGFDPSGGTWKWQGTLDPTYVVVAPGADTLPDYGSILGNAQIQYQLIVNDPQPYVTFQLSAPAKVSVGIVINYIQAGQGFKSTQVSLYNYPKHL